MKIVSVNTGQPRAVSWRGRSVTTGIFKTPLGGPVAVRQHQLAGDGQADLRVHGGPDKAVYCYPSEHYPYWREQFPDVDMPWGMFGENLTTEGLLEGDACIGDRWRVGTAELRVVQPRVPCYKLGIRFGRDDVAERFLAAGRPGLYLAVEAEGELQAGDAVEVIERDPHRLTVADAYRLYTSDRDDLDLLRRAVAAPGLPAGWRRGFQQRLDGAGAS